MKAFYLFVLLLSGAVSGLLAQDKAPVVTALDLQTIPAGTRQHLWVQIITDAFGQPVCVPVIVAKGASPGPVVGITAAIHGDELNGIPIVQRLLEGLDPKGLKGTVVGIPGLNVPGIQRGERRFPDEEDLNRNFPGNPNGSNSEQYNHRIFSAIIRHVDYLFDLHTASFGRVNAFYVRADLRDSVIAKLAYLQPADIIVDNAGPTASSTGSGKTLREEAYLSGIPCITIECGDPHVYQEDMILRGVQGMRNALGALGMIPSGPGPDSKAVVCRKSYWLYTDAGGFLEVTVGLNQKIRKGELVGILRNPFGEILRRYYAPEDGIVIGKSTHPVNISGGRILHLGILK